MYREDSKRSVNAVSRLELFHLARLHERHSHIISYDGANVCLARRVEQQLALTAATNIYILATAFFLITV